MKSIRSFAQFMIGSLVVLAIPAAVFSQDCSKASTLIQRLNEEHLNPRLVNDSLSQDIFREVFLQFDPARIYFHQKDIRLLEKFKFLIDDELLGSKCDFQTAFKALLIKKTEKTKDKIDSILSKEFTFQPTETWPAGDRKSIVFEKNERALTERLSRSLKFDLLSESIEKYRFTDTTKISFQKLKAMLPSTRTEQRREFQESFVELLKDIQQGDLFEATYLRAISKVYDPHSEYFNLKKRKEFDEQLSNERLSLGIDLDENDFGQVQVAHIVPGGPAWKTGQVHKGDILLQLAWDNQPPVNLTEKDIDEIIEVLYEAEGRQAALTVLKPTGEKITIDLHKEKIENTENSINGFVLAGQHKIGYIHLPGFFTDETESSPNGCANEVAKEILKLNKQKIEGLILDLRDNGGGSLREAVDLAGIFVDVGPMAILEMKNQEPITAKDMNRGMAFTGPMIVLVNGHSASASELVAAALQDYNRAVIVGSQTFGKATGQVVLPLTKNSETDFFKVTSNRLYRLTQKSLQQTGVVPDINLPELAAPLRNSERNYRFSLTNKSIEKKTYYNVLPVFYVRPLRELSEARLKANPNFVSIRTINEILVKSVPLSPEAYVNYTNELESHLKNVSSARQESPYQIATAEAFSSPLDSYRKPSEAYITEIKNNPYIQEAFNIMCDIIQSKVK